MARKPRKRVLVPKVSTTFVKDAAARAEARSRGEEPEHTPVPITPPIVPASEIITESSSKRKDRAIAKRRRRKVSYSPAVGKAVCKMIVMGVPVIRIGKRPLMPSESTIYAWARTPGHPFADAFARAREVSVRRMADEMLEIADNSAGDVSYKTARDGETILPVVNREAIERARLRIETRKWLMTKLLPEFADKAQVEHSGRVDTAEAPQSTGDDHMAHITERYMAKVPAAKENAGSKSKANGSVH